MKILVAMSGGVDSTITAHILKKQGHEVIGVNFKFVGADPEFVGADIIRSHRMGEFHEPELDDIARTLGIKILYRDFRSEFRDKIIKSFVEDYERGITPNPCAICNATMKFEKLLEVMKEENCDMVATGHYANIATVGSNATVEANACGALVGAKFTSPHRYCIKKSTNQQKDQSYMLYRLNQEQLSHIIFPLSNMDKTDVRKIAAELNLEVANKKDSQDVCFINSVGASTASPIDYKEFIKCYEFGDDYKEKIARGLLKEEEILSRPYFRKGEFVDLNGNVLGFHNGIINYTIGQRKGLNIAFGSRKFVVKIDAEKNQVVLGDNDDLMSSDFIIRDVVYSGHNESVIGKKFYAKLRYRHEGTLCEVVGDDILSSCVGAKLASPHNTLACHLSSPVRAITPGQSAVFYDEDGRVMFGGIIV